MRTAPAAEPPSGTAPRWWALDPPDVLAELRTTAAGLSDEDAGARLHLQGRNELDFTPSAPWWRLLLRQFLGPVISILLVAAVVSLAQRHYVDAAAIFLILCVNAAIGFWQERKAEADVRALQSLSIDDCRVLRSGAERVVPTPEVVPGDVLLLESGERVPADLRLIDSNALRVDESMLTGESAAVTKRVDRIAEDAQSGRRANMVYSGTFITGGRGVGVVTATGPRTELGHINELVQGPAGKGPLQLLTHRLERQVGVIALAAVTFVFLVGVLLGEDLSDMLRTAVGLAVASIPESLPIVLTVAMSVGVSRMAKRNAIIRTLPSVETLGSTTVIASDKTGTLTQNRLTVERVWSPGGSLDLIAELPSRPGSAGDALHPSISAVLRAGAFTNEATRTPGTLDFTGDTVDVAMARAALLHDVLSDTEFTATFERHAPYEPDLRYSQTAHRHADGRRFLYVKGATDTLLAMSEWMDTPDGVAPLDADLVAAANARMASDGLRVIATASRELHEDEELDAHLPPPEGLTFLGLQGMSDPPRPEVAAAIRSCQDAGIAVKMLTGDQPLTALSIAARLGMATDAAALTGTEMAELDDRALAARLAQTNVAARVAPQDKLRIVKLLQELDHVVAVTGDGINDAPALKAASIGVAMGRSGTDVARESADLVLTDDNFVTIVHAVEQGRVTFSAIRKAMFFLLSRGAAALLAMAANVVMGLPLLFLPVQLLWINIVTSGLQDVALALEPAEGDELRRPPRGRGEGLLSRTLWIRTAVTGVWMAAVISAAFWWSLDVGTPEDEARTFALTVFVMLSFFQVQSARAQYRSLFRLNPLGNRLLLFTSIGAVLVHWGAMHWSVSADLLTLVPLTASEWAACVGLGSSVLIIVELEKLTRRVTRRRRAARSPDAGPRGLDPRGADTGRDLPR